MVEQKRMGDNKEVLNTAAPNQITASLVDIVKRLEVTAGFDLMSIKKPPHDPGERRVASALVSERLLVMLEGRLSCAEAALWDAMKSQDAEAEHVPGSEQIWAKFDELIIDQTATIGWRINLSDVALRRIQQWNDVKKNGPELLARWADALCRNAQSIRGEKKKRHPIASSEFYASRKAALKEVRVLSKKLNSEFVLGSASVRYQLPAPAALCALIRNEITNMQSAYPFLFMNLSSLFRHLELRDAEEQGTFSKRFVTRQATPGELVDGWFDWAFNTPEGQSRKIISQLGNRKHK